MADMGDPSWNEVDASNNTAPPTGWPDGQQPSTVKQTARAMMGALKRFWDRSNSVLTTAGTTTAYTLTYAQAASVYYAGEEFAFIANATCGAAPTLNVNSLGARNLRKFSGGAWTNCAAGDIQANQAVRCYYNSGAMTFDIAAQAGAGVVWTAIDSQTPSGAANYDIHGISTTINQLEIDFALSFSVDNNTLGLQFYNSTGTLDTSSVYYAGRIAVDAGGNFSASGGGSLAAINIAGAIQNSSTVRCNGTIRIQDIQAATNTQCTWGFTNALTGSGLGIGGSGWGGRNATGGITGVRLIPVSGGTISGRVTTIGTSN